MRIPYLGLVVIGLYILGSSFILASALHELARIERLLAGCGLR